LNYKADLEEIQELFLEMGQPALMSPIRSKTTRELDVTGYEWYKANHFDVWSLITEHVSVTPKKVSVTLKPAQEKK
ncbi:unnamed protein product, partial [marine sediment metagenome]